MNFNPDINEDGNVDLADALILSGQYRKPAPRVFDRFFSVFLATTLRGISTLPAVLGTTPCILDGGLRYSLNAPGEPYREASAYVGGYHGPREQIDPEAMAAMGRQMPAGSMLIHNIEHPSRIAMDIERDGEARVKEYVAFLMGQMKVIKDTCPHLIIGLWGEILSGNTYWDGVNLSRFTGSAKQRLLDRIERGDELFQPLIDMLDVMVPVAYDRYLGVDGQPGFDLQNERLRRRGQGKPIVPCLSHRLHNRGLPQNGQPVPIDEFKAQAAFNVRHPAVDGLLIWTDSPTHSAPHVSAAQNVVQRIRGPKR